MKDSPGKFSVQKRIKSFYYAFKGIKSLIVYEHNARIHLTALLFAVMSGVYFDIDATEWIAIVIVSGMVFTAEIFNSAVERLADYVEPEKSKKIALIKDYSAAAVLVSATVSVIVGALVFFPKIEELVKHLYR
jgi:diacylglycerol kinase